MIPALTTWRANPPQFVTFTGADAQTSILGMQLLAEQFPVEWGILFSPERQGAGRYPPLEFVHELTERPGLRLAAHLCGGYALEFLDTLDCADLRDLLPAFRSR